MGMAIPRLPSKFEKDSNMPPHHRFGLGEPAGGLQHKGEVVEIYRNVGMVRAQASLVDGKRAAHKGLRFGQPVHRLQQSSEIVEAGRDLRVVWPKVAFEN